MRSGWLLGSAVAVMTLTAGGRALAFEAAATEVEGIIVTAPPSDGYDAERSSAATKTDTPLRDTPQAVSVITAEVIRDQAMESMAEVFRYVPGVGSGQGEGNRDAPVMRGQATTADFYVDGVRDDVQYFRDLYNAERVEVLKGPNAMIFGRGGGGGVVNRVTKKADGRRLREVVVEAGSFDHTRAVADLDQPLGGDFAGRVVWMYQDSDSFRDDVGLERWAVNPTLRYRPNDRFTAVFGYEHLDDRRTADRGIPSFAGRPAPAAIQTFFGAPDQSHAQVTADLASAVLEGRIGERLVVRNHLLFGDYDKFYQNIYPGAAADQPLAGMPTRATLSAYNNSARRKNQFNQTDLVWQPAGGRVEHTVLVGAEFGHQTTDNFRNTGFFGTATSLFVPFAAPAVAGAPASFRQSAGDADNHVEAKVAGAYVQDQLEIGGLQVVAGLRYDAFRLHFFNHRNGARLSRTDKALSPRLGLVFKPIEPLSLYASYAVSFLPSSGDQFSSLTATTQTLKPERFESRELGFKWAARSGVDITGALYELVRDHTSARDPGDPGRIIQTGEQRSRGMELSAAGEITSRWRIIAAYAWQDAKITQATLQSATAGKHAPLTPAHAAALWNKVDLTPRWAVALGVIHQSGQFAAIDNSVILPAFSRIDAGLYWTAADDIQLQANVENLTDRRYFPTSNGNNNIAPGAPRTVRISLRTKF